MGKEKEKEKEKEKRSLCTCEIVGVYITMSNGIDALLLIFPPFQISHSVGSISNGKREYRRGSPKSNPKQTL